MFVVGVSVTVGTEVDALDGTEVVVVVPTGSFCVDLGVSVVTGFGVVTVGFFLTTNGFAEAAAANKLGRASPSAGFLGVHRLTGGLGLLAMANNN